MWFHIGKSDTNTGFWTEVRVQDYLIEIDRSYECQICIRDTGVDDNTWYFGTTWFSGFYVEFDRTAGTMGITQALNGSKVEWETDVSTPSRVFGTNWTTVGLYCMGIGISAILFIILTAFAYCCYYSTMLRGSSQAKKISKESPHSELVEHLDGLIKKQQSKAKGVLEQEKLESNTNSMV